jgi:predicted  nucleic acid-binding Zn-ribbon protein
MINRIAGLIEQDIKELNDRKKKMEKTLHKAMITNDKQLEKYARHFLEVVYDRMLKDYKETQARFL